MIRKVGRRTFLLIVIVILAVAGGVPYMLRKGEAQFELTPKNLNEYLVRFMQSERYIKGGQNLAAFEKGQRLHFTDAEYEAWGELTGSMINHISANFLYSLTPEQIKKIGGENGHLGYAELNPEQQKLLLLSASVQHAYFPMGDPYSKQSYAVSYGRFAPSPGSCPTLQWYFPANKVTSGEHTGEPSFNNNSFTMNW